MMLVLTTDEPRDDIGKAMVQGVRGEEQALRPTRVFISFHRILFTGVYDDAAAEVRKQDADALLAAHRTKVLLPFSGLSQNSSLLQELIVLFEQQWDSTRGCYGTKLTTSAADVRAATAKIDYQHGLSQILQMTVDLLVTKSLPFGQRLQVAPNTVFPTHDGNDPFPSDNFDQRYSSQPPLPYTEAEMLRHGEIFNLAFQYHPFLALIVCRTIFLGKVDDRTFDKASYDSILLAGMDVKESLSQPASSSSIQPCGLPNNDELVRRVTSSLYVTKPGAVKASLLHTPSQCLMILAWHELTHGLLRRATTWWTTIWGYITRIHALRQQEKPNSKRTVNGVDPSLIAREELANMQAVSQLVLLWLELSLGPASASTSSVPFHAPSQAHENGLSWILELDHRSGNFAAMQASTRISALLRSIRRVFVSLSESCNAWGSCNVILHSRVLRDGPWTDNSQHTSLILSRARVFEANSGQTPLTDVVPVAAVISLTALLVCFQSRGMPTNMTTQRLIDIVKVCSAITLQLRDTFSDDGSTADLAPTRVAHSSRDILFCSGVTLTIVETVALTLELLVTHVDPEGVADNSENVLRMVIWPPEAKQTITDKLGSISGIITTIIECFENVPKHGKRPRHILNLLGRTQEQLNRLDVQPDISFALDLMLPYGASDVAREAQQLSHERSQPTFNTSAQPPDSFVNPTTALATQSWLQQQQTTAPSVISSEPPYIGDAYPTPPCMNSFLPPLPRGPIWHGPGPIPTERREPVQASGTITHGHSVEASFPAHFRPADHYQAAYSWSGGSHEATASAPHAYERYSGMRTACGEEGQRTTPALLLSQAASELQQQCTDEASAGHSTQPWSFERPTVALQPSLSREYSLVPFYHLDDEDTLTDDLHRILTAGHAMHGTAVHHGFGSDLAPQARTQDDRGPYAQPQPANTRLEAPLEARASKRPRTDVRMQDTWWTKGQVDVVGLRPQPDGSLSNQQPLQLGQEMATRTGTSQETGQGAAERDDDHLPAAEALASIQSMISLMEEASATAREREEERNEAEAGDGASDLTDLSSSPLIEGDNEQEDEDEDGDDGDDDGDDEDQDEGEDSDDDDNEDSNDDDNDNEDEDEDEDEDETQKDAV